MFKSLKRRDYIVLAVFWLSIVCVIGLMLTFFLIRSSNLSQPVYQVTPGEVTALSMYPLAEAAALAWESDVQFISASTTWNNASLAEFERPTEWVYRFYSPGLERILFVIVTPDQKVIVRPHLARIRRELRVVDPSTWQLDSPAALAAWLNSGGGAWMQQSSSRIVSAQLAFNLEQNTPMWTISGLNPETSDSVQFTIEAVSP
jgi:hypothetical protein